MKKKLISLSILLGTTIFSQIGAQYAPTDDLDGDGIINSIDLDDDNDGIPDCVEKQLDNVTINSLFHLVGSSTTGTVAGGDNILRLTDGVTKQQAGAAWSRYQVNLAQPFTVTFNAYLGTNNGGADGIAMVFHNDSSALNAVGAAGLAMGAGNIKNGIALELDTFRNGSGSGDISDDHGAIFDTDARTFVSGSNTVSGGTGYILSSARRFAANQIFGPALNLEDGNWHTVVITWDPTTRTISYTVDGFLGGTYTHSGTLDNFCSTYFNIPETQKNKLVWFGYTASTGDFLNEQKIRLTDTCNNYELFHIDTDGDGILDYLDWDSDGDGCPDSIEGGGNILFSDLNTNTSISGGVNTQGIPLKVGTGQTRGTSIDATVTADECKSCLRLPKLNAGVKMPTQHGITSLGRAGWGGNGYSSAVSDNWPLVRQSAWTVLEAKKIGFVVNRMPFHPSGVPMNIPATNFVEGMMVYDTTNQCLKIYDGTKWGCVSTPGCPQ